MGYDRSQGFLGSERLLVAMLDDPEWVRDIFTTGVQLLIDGAEEMMGRGFDFDGALLYDDMGYRNGPLFSPQLYRELLFPCHKRIVDFFHGRGLKVILHSCG
ncbi:MAG: uroporphyrinogen decarboxylase family protein [Candidatus Oleimicrobiaceae bacterium]